MKPEPTIPHIEKIPDARYVNFPVTTCVHKINEIIEVINQLIPNKPKVYTEEESRAIEIELYETLQRIKEAK